MPSRFRVEIQFCSIVLKYELWEKTPGCKWKSPLNSIIPVDDIAELVNASKNAIVEMLDEASWINFSTREKAKLKVVSKRMMLSSWLNISGRKYRRNHRLRSTNVQWNKAKGKISERKHSFIGLVNLMVQRNFSLHLLTQLHITWWTR